MTPNQLFDEVIEAYKNREFAQKKAIDIGSKDFQLQVFDIDYQG